MLIARIEKVSDNAAQASNLIDVCLLCNGRETGSFSVRLDTGADVSAFPKWAVENMDPPARKEVLMRAYDGTVRKERMWGCKVNILGLGWFDIPRGCVSLDDETATPSLGMDVLSQLDVRFNKGQAVLSL